MIHTIGDSHSINGWSGVITHHLGPVLCYSFGKKLWDIRNFNIKHGDTIIFCFGEIDCRCHIHKHITATRTYQHIIDDIIDNYFKAIGVLISALQLKLKICVYNVVPPIQKYNTKENPAYPYLGSDEERKQYVVYFNKKLKEACIRTKSIFFDVYHQYADENGFLKKELSDGNVHIGNGIHLHHFIKEHRL